MSKHTPGPWYVGRSESGYIVCNVGSLEVTTNEDDPEQYDVEADARLIAAAPDLLEALELALASHNVFLTGNPAQDAWLSRGVESKARDAIAKAKGEQG